METKFTKGPWELGQTTSEHPFCIDAYCNDDGLRFELCEVLGVNDEFKACEQSKANAHLIKTSPKMYEMLESLRENYGENDHVGIEIDDLLAKARGE